MLCALAMEGRFTSEGLSQNRDLCTSLAKKLLQQDGVRESASSVLANVGQGQYQNHSKRG